jgi:O-antigen/teichoic acid export membrane protein
MLPARPLNRREGVHRMSFLRNATGVLLTSVAEAVVGFAASIVLARWLSVEDRGFYAIALTFGTALVVLARLGLPSSAIYQMRRTRTPPAQVAATTLALGLGLAALVAAIAVVFRAPISREILEGAPPELFWLALLAIPPQIVLQLCIGLARGMDRFALANRYTIATNVAGMLAVVVVLVALGGGVAEALLAFAAARLAFALLFLRALLRLTGALRRVSLSGARESLGYALKSYAQVLSGEIHERVDILLLAWLLSDPHAVALYTVAVGLIDRMKMIPDAIASALFPQISALDAQAGSRVTSLVSRHTVAWVGIALVGFAAVGPWLLPLAYGAPYAGSVAPFLILLPAMAFHSLYKVVARYFMAVDRQQVNIVTQGLALVLNVGLNLWLIPRLGITGAALSSLASYAFEALLISVAFLWDSQLGAREAFAPRASDLALYRDRLGRLRARGAGGTRPAGPAD